MQNLEDCLEAQAAFEEMQRDRDPDEQREICGRLRSPYEGNPDDTPEDVRGDE